MQSADGTCSAQHEIRGDGSGKRIASMDPRTSRVARGITIRRTVATICLVLPEEELPSLASSIRGKASMVAISDGAWHAVSLHVKNCILDMAKELSQLHKAGISHMCISPANVFIDVPMSLRLGDFLGKLHTLKLQQEHSGVADEWAIWQPPEVLELASGADVVIDPFLVDAWQLGAVIFYLATGQHPY